MTGYTSTYETDDLSAITVDAIGALAAEFVPWVAVIVLLVILGFVLGRFSEALRMFGKK